MLLILCNYAAAHKYKQFTPFAAFTLIVSLPLYSLLVLLALLLLYYYFIALALHLARCKYVGEWYISEKYVF